MPFNKNNIKKITAISMMCFTMLNNNHILAAKTEPTQQTPQQTPTQQQPQNEFSDKKEAVLARLHEYAADELSDSMYYETLAMNAPDEMFKNMLLAFAKDEKRHAEEIAAIIKKMSGKDYTAPKIEQPTIPNNFKDALLVRIKSETNDYKKYSKEYMAAKKDYLKQFFFNASIDENIHAQRIQYLIDILSS